MSFLDATGAQYLISKIKAKLNLTPSLVPYGTAIPANANLNSINYLRVGNYYCSLTATAATITNAPADIAFMMEVTSPLSTTIDNESTETWVYRVRKFTTYTGVEYVQEVSSDETPGSFTYGVWKRIVDSSLLATELASISGGGGTTKFTNKTVAVSDWAAETINGETTYKADISCSGVTGDDMAIVVFSQEDVDSGLFTSTCLTGAGVVTIYAEAIPANPITIPTIAIL